MSKLSTEIDEKLKIYRELQNDIQTLFAQKQKVLSQFNENTLVKGELDLEVAGANVYKLVGPVLMSIDLEEAKENVGKRLEFIEAEVLKVDVAIGAKQKELNTLGDEIAKRQQQMQAEAAEAVRNIIPSGSN